MESNKGMSSFIDRFKIGYYQNANCIICKKQGDGLYLFDGTSIGICHNCFRGIYDKVDKLVTPKPKEG